MIDLTPKHVIDYGQYREHGTCPHCGRCQCCGQRQVHVPEVGTYQGLPTSPPQPTARPYWIGKTLRDVLTGDPFVFSAPLTGDAPAVTLNACL